jgi:hypothetical protein
MLAILDRFNCILVNKSFIYQHVSQLETMPPQRRLARAKQLITACIKLGRAKAKRIAQRTANLRNSSSRNDLGINEDPILTDGLSEQSEMPSFKELTPNSNGDTSSLDSSSSSWSSSEGWMSEAESDDDEMCSLAGIRGWTMDDDDDSEDEMDISDFDDGNEGDDEEAEETDSEWDGLDNDIGQGHSMRRWVRAEIESMYASRYEAPRKRLPRGPPFVHHVLNVQKHQQPDQFRQALRVSPATFDHMVERISNDPVFSNDSPNAQISVELQLSIALYRFGHDGNAVSQQMVAHWGGVGKGTVCLITHRVMTAVLQPNFMQEAVRYPTDEEKERAKEWVAEHSCRAWRHGWLSVDGTLIPLYKRPNWYGESYFDRKCNYSLNVQVMWPHLFLCRD